MYKDLKAENIKIQQMIEGHLCNYSAEGVSQNPLGPPALGTIPEAFKASFVVTAQPAADPRGTVCLEVGSPLHGHVKHAYHADGNHSDPNLVNFLHVFSSSSRFMSSMRWNLICKLFD